MRICHSSVSLAPTRHHQGHATDKFGPAKFSSLYEQHDAAVGEQAPQMSSIEDLLAEPGTESHAKATAGGASTVSIVL